MPIAPSIGFDHGNCVFDRFLTVFNGVLVDLEIPAGKTGEWLTVFEDARGQILNR
jgi:hypothetical protein